MLNSLGFFSYQKGESGFKKHCPLYTKKWGINQRNTYLTQIDTAFHMLSDNPAKGFSCDYIRQGYFKYGVGKHLIFYRIINLDIEIVRILHERMNIEQRLRED
ncbi:MAG: type II toxin-antitoxin system RelE/ParE family toxin [Cytophagales bacterium]|nr:type II toxin-antitoxin system RelE/ParE family toxin [Cytophagales bacterium]